MINTEDILKLEDGAVVYVCGYKRGKNHFGSYINFKPELGKIEHTLYSGSTQVYRITVCVGIKKKRYINVARYSYNSKKLEFDSTYAVDLTLTESIKSYNKMVQDELSIVENYFDSVLNNIKNSLITDKEI